MLCLRYKAKPRHGGINIYTTKSGRPISYYGKEYTSDIQRKNGNGNIIYSIDQLFGMLLEVWCRDTAYPSCQIDYNCENDPTYGQCAITATLVYDMFGGTIHKVKVDGGGTHYFNMIKDHYIDLTRDQFDLYDIPLEYDCNETIPREYCGKNPNTLKRYQLLVHLISEWLAVNKKGADAAD